MARTRNCCGWPSSTRSDEGYNRELGISSLHGGSLKNKRSHLVVTVSSKPLEKLFFVNIIIITNIQPTVTILCPLYVITS